MPSRATLAFPKTDSADKMFKNKEFYDETIDGYKYSGFQFEFCTFNKIGMKSATFENCKFRHCDFVDCYFVDATFEASDFTGSLFERSNFTWAKFPRSKMDYTRFYECAPVLSQIRDQKPTDPQAAAKFFRNLAIEHKNRGNWDEVDRLIYESFRERERHYWMAFTGANEHYKKRYGGWKRLKYLGRYVFSGVNRAVWGYGFSWMTFSKTLALTFFVILPLTNALLGKLVNRSKFFWTENPFDDVFRYLSVLYGTTAQAFFPFLPSALLQNLSELQLPGWLVFGEAVTGTVFLALLVSMIFRSISKGL